MPRTSTPARTASSTRRAGEQEPSDSLVCECRSIKGNQTRTFQFSPDSRHAFWRGPRGTAIDIPAATCYHSSAMKILLMCTLLTATAYSQALPHMEKRGQATQLIVDGKPFLALSGELANTAPSNLDYMRHIFPILASQVHLNTVLTAMAWAWIEPQEGKYDFHLADAAIELANQNDLRIA